MYEHSILHDQYAHDDQFRNLITWNFTLMVFVQIIPFNDTLIPRISEEKTFGESASK